MSSIFDGLASIFVGVMGDDELARYARADGSWSGDVRPIFDDPSMVLDAGNGKPAVERDTKFHFSAADLVGGWGQNDTITFRNRSWVVRAALPDGHGMVAMMVEAA